MIRQFVASLTSDSDKSNGENNMLKRFSITACFLLLNIALVSSSFGAGNPEKDAKLVEKVKANIAKLGTGPDAKVQIKLKDGTKIKGYVTEVNESHFRVMDSKTGQDVPVLYPTVKQVKGNNLSTGAFVAIAVGVAILFIVFAAYSTR